MELGSWAIIQAPSLLALIPLFVFIVLVFLGKSNTAGIIVGIGVGALLLGQNLKALAVAFASSLGSSVALIGLIIMTGAGLGVLMTEARITHTLVYWIVKRVGVNTQTRAKVALIVCSIIVCGLLGTLGGGNAVIAPIIIPIMAAVGLTPSVVCALLKVSGEVGLILGPLTGVTLITMEVTGLSYGQLVIGASLPFAIFWLGGTWFAVKRTQKRTEGKEAYDMGDDVKNIEEYHADKKAITSTIVFLISFVLLVIYGILSKQGTNYALIVMILLAAIVAIVSRTKIDDAIDSLTKGMASQAGMFIVFVTIDVLLTMVDVGGGFAALSDLLSGVASNNASVIMIIASIVGGFGIEAAAVAEIKIISEMFIETAKAAGLPMTMFAIALMAATRLTGSIYPTSNMAGQLGIARCSNTKEVLQANWISAGVVWAFVFIWAFVGVLILG